MALFLGFFCTVAVNAKNIRVSGVIRHIDLSREKPVPYDAVVVYSASTRSEANDIINIIENKNGLDEKGLITQDMRTVTDESGYYDILVSDGGFLIFRPPFGKVSMEEVKGRNVIDKFITDDSRMLKNIVVTGVRTELKPKPRAPKMFGDRLALSSVFPIPDHMGSNYSRLIIQPFVIDCMTGDTIQYVRPQVYDGTEYHRTQLRKKGYDFRNDPLTPYIIKDQPLTADRMTVLLEDTVSVPDPSHNYSAYATVNLEDYGNIISNKTYLINTCQTKRPFRFLQYDLLTETMDPDQHPERPQIERRNISDKINLTFKIGSDELVDNDENKANLESLRKRLESIASSEGSTLREFHVIGTASPDGNYSRNLQLARQRVSTLQKTILAGLPSGMFSRVSGDPEARVASWQELADILRGKGKEDEAKQVEAVVASTRNFGKQWAAMRKLPFYRTDVMPALEELRAVRYSCSYEIYRAPLMEETVAEYKRKGTDNTYTRYEYWQLFKYFIEQKDTAGLMKVYQAAYDESVKINANRPWVLPANNLAVLEMAQGKYEAKLLTPFVDRTVSKVNFERRNADTGVTTVINPVEVVNNLLCVYVKNGDYDNASVLTQILPNDEKHRMLKAYADVMGGYFDGGSTPEERARIKANFDLVKSTSPQNAVVMYLALESPAGDEEAAKAIEALPQDAALTYYFKAVLSARKGEMYESQTINLLMECYKRDKKFMIITQNDGEFEKDTVQTAMDMMSN